MNFEPLESRRLMSVSLYNGILTVDGGLFTNNLSVSQSGSTLTVSDNGAVSSHSAAGIAQVWLVGKGGNDQLSADGVTINARIDGGNGHDWIIGGQGNDAIYGGPGNDTVRGGPLSPPPVVLRPAPIGFNPFYDPFVIDRTQVFIRPPSYPDNDVIYGDSGNDRLVGGIGADNIYGGAGTDLVEYSSRSAGVAVSLDDLANDGTFDVSTWGSTEFDNVHGDVENVQGGSGNDRLYGNAANNALFGDAGNDELYGYAGDDYLEGAAGGDWLDAGDGNDVVSAGEGNDTVYGGAGDDRVDAMGGADWVYAGDGNDTLRGGNDNDVLFGNAGNDALYGGAGNDSLFAGDGNDVLVSIGGGQSDYVMGEGGSDSFWVDAEGTETVADLSPAEAAAGHLHRVGAFFSNTGISPGGVPLTLFVSRELDGQNLPDPAVFPVTFSNGTTETPTYSNFSSTPLFGPGGPSTNDIQQNAVGDCYFLATLSATAKVNPDRIRQSVVDLGDGTFAVQFFRNGVANFVRTDADLPRLSSGQMAYAGRANNTLWGPIMEKAYAYFRKSDGRYDSIASGTAGETFDALGCVSGWWVRPFWQSSGGWLTDIQNSINSGKAVTLSTGWPLSGPDLVGSHVYAVDHVNFDAGGNATGVVLRNPWAQDTANGASADGVNDGFITVSAHDVYWSTLIAHFATV